MGTEVPGLSPGPGRADRSSAGEHRTIQSEGAGDVAWQPESHQQRAARSMGVLRARLVGIFPAGRGAKADLPAGGMDTVAHPKMLLAAMAFGCRPGSSARTARVTRPNAESGTQLARGVASGRNGQFANGSVEWSAAALWLPHAIGSCGTVNAAGFNRRIRKTVRTVVWEGDGAQSPSLDLILVTICCHA